MPIQLVYLASTVAARLNTSDSTMRLTSLWALLVSPLLLWVALLLRKHGLLIMLNITLVLLFSLQVCPPAAVASTIAALEIIKSEPERRERLWKNVKKMKSAFEEMGFDTCGSQSPVIPIVIGEMMDTFVFWKRLFESGVFANPAVPPAVPPGKSLIRTSYMATHTDEELNKVLDIFEKLGKEFHLI